MWSSRSSRGLRGKRKVSSPRCSSLLFPSKRPSHLLPILKLKTKNDKLLVLSSRRAFVLLYSLDERKMPRAPLLRAWVHSMHIRWDCRCILWDVPRTRFARDGPKKSAEILDCRTAFWFDRNFMLNKSPVSNTHLAFTWQFTDCLLNRQVSRRVIFWDFNSAIWTGCDLITKSPIGQKVSETSRTHKMSHDALDSIKERRITRETRMSIIRKYKKCLPTILA